MGIISVAAHTLVTTKNFMGLVDETCMASICSVTFIDPNSAPMPDAIFPAQINPVITGPISLISETATMPGRRLSAPKSTKTGRVCIVSTKPIMLPVTEMSGNDL